jgi:hypothetical protein
MNFGELQEDVMQDHIGFTLGQAVSGSAGGRIRAAVVDNRTRVRYANIESRLEIYIDHACTLQNVPKAAKDARDEAPAWWLDYN